MTDFIMDNTVWVIVFGVLIVMALIGYMAENSRKTKAKEKKSGKEEISKEKVREEEKEIPVEVHEEPTSTSIADAIESSMPTFEQSTSTENVPSEQVSASTEPDPITFEIPAEQNPAREVTPEVASTVTSTGEDLTVPLTSNAVSTPQMEAIPETNSIESILTETNIAMEQAPQQSQTSSSPSSLGVDDVSQLFAETKKEESPAPEDVWKF